MLDKVKIWVKGVWRKLFPVSTIESALSIKVDQDTLMNRAIELWTNMYENKPPWLSDTVSSMNLPASISNEIARLVTLELESIVSGSARADYLNTQYQKVISSIRTYTEYACAKGGLVFKPYVDGKEINVEYVQADYFYPVRYGSDGSITEAAFVEQKQVGEMTYTRLEYHDFDGVKETITNKAYKSKSKDTLGTEIPLTAVEEWKDLQPKASVENIEKPMFAYFKIPIANNVDTYSPLGESVFGRAIDLIKEADKQYSRSLWEFESAERAIDVDTTAFKFNPKTGKAEVPEGKERLFRTMDAEGGNNGKTFYETFSPEIRDESHARGLNNLLRLIEFNCGLAYGTLSDPQEESKTATEVKQSKQRSYSTVSDIQKALQSALEHLVYIMDVYVSLYNLSSKGKYEISFVWDDSIVVDAEAERLRDIQEMREGIMSKVEYRMKWYGEDEATAKKKIAEVQNENPSDDEIIGFEKGDA